MWGFWLLLLSFVHEPHCAGAFTVAHKQGSTVKLHENPIRKVIDLLQTMKDRVERESKKESALFDKYTCFCSEGTDNLQKSVAQAKLRSPQIKASLEVSQNAADRLDHELSENKEERHEIETRVKDVSGMRSYQAADFTNYAAQAKAEMKALDAAILRLQGGLPELLQEDAAALRQLAQSQKFLQRVKVEGAQEMLEEVADENFEAPSSGSADEVVGICKQLRERMQKEFDTATTDEDKKNAGHHTLLEASEGQIKALTAAIEAKTVRIGKLKVDVVELQEDLEATDSTLDNDVGFSADVSKTCNTIKETYTTHMASRSQEMVTLTSTIEVLNRDKSMELFKKVRPPSFLQVAATSHSESRKSKRAEALRLLRTAKAVRHKLPRRLDLIILALQGRGRKGAKKNEFAMVIKNIDSMVQVLKQEQKTDYNKREYCLKEIRDSKSALRVVVDNKKVAKETKNDEDLLETIKEEIAEKVESTKRLDAAMEDSKLQRAENHEGFMEVIMTNRAALEILDLAKNTLLKFYNPKYSPQDFAGATPVEGKLNANEFGPGAMAVMRGMTGVQTDADEDEDEDEEDDDEQPKVTDSRKQTSITVIELLAKLDSEIKRDTAEADTEEANHKASFAMLRKDALGERTVLTRTLMRKQEVKAHLEKHIHKLRGVSAAMTMKVKELETMLRELTQECDFLLKNYDNRQVARTNEEDALKRAAAVLAN